MVSIMDPGETYVLTMWLRLLAGNAEVFPFLLSFNTDQCFLFFVLFCFFLFYIFRFHIILSDFFVWLKKQRRKLFISKRRFGLLPSFYRWRNFLRFSDDRYFWEGLCYFPDSEEFTSTVKPRLYSVFSRTLALHLEYCLKKHLHPVQTMLWGGQV